MACRVCLLAWLLLMLAARRANAVEPWADSRLPVKAGLEMWLDAQAQNKARRAMKRPPVRDGDPVDVWLDGSGKSRHVEQVELACQPRWTQLGQSLVARFDGVNDSLGKTGLAREYTDLSVVIVVNPFFNAGDFRGMLAMNQTAVNDYTSGLNLDLGPFATVQFESLNPEGPGFGGARDLMRHAFDFGFLHTLALVSAAGPNGVRVFVDGERSGSRERKPTTIRMDRVTLGARFYNNAGPANVRGFLEGDIAELLVYDRALDDANLAAVLTYLRDKYAPLRATKVDRPPPAGGGKRLVRVTCPPVQMLVPGFSAQQIPIDLTNVNNIRCRDDGKLVALAYNGNVYLLDDADGDGLHDRARLFWDNQGRLRGPIGMALVPNGYKCGNGLFVASKGKCSMLLDADRDDRAEQELVIASGWRELPHNVDALGVALDPRDQSVWFGIGTADFTNPYLVGKDGKSHYRLSDERGTIIRVEPDFSRRAIVCTGIRFPVGMAFSPKGDLFCTDQEGATWLANGNPFDELLHIERGRHYGFPPRHPIHLSNVIDEPSVYDFAPQHQSTCGLVFNSRAGGAPFGPVFWTDDAITCGYSRGKLYRTTLCKTPAGYVAQNQLIGCLAMLTVDACVTKAGDLVVAAHSGGPDWGSGPSGKGKLFRIRYADQSAPQPVLAWASTDHEVQIAFDRPIPTGYLERFVERTQIEFGRYVAAADRFEALWPGYQVVQDQMNAPRFDLPVHSVQISPDRRTLIIATGPQQADLSYAVKLAAFRRATQKSSPEEIIQSPDVDVAYDLSGVEVQWRSNDGASTWSGWLPHFDLSVCEQLTAASAQHERLWSMLRQMPGHMMLASQLDLTAMLRPAVQPGSSIDYESPDEQVTLKLESTVEHDATLRFTTLSSDATAERQGHGLQTTWTLAPKSNEAIRFDIRFPTYPDRAGLTVTYCTSDDARPRALPLRRFRLPWSRRQASPIATVAHRAIPELQGASWSRGRRLFLDDKMQCVRCHAFQGTGGVIGPDLSNLTHRDLASVRRDIVEPNFTINPDYITYAVGLKDGRVLSGVVRSENAGRRLTIGDEKGSSITIGRDEVEVMSPAAVSTMPSDLLKSIDEAGQRDLFAFLLGAGPRMPDYGRNEPPPPRSRAEVTAVLAGAEKLPDKLPPMKITLVAGRKDHGPGEHDYPAWQKVWAELLAVDENVTVASAMDWPSKDDFASADCIVFFQQGKWRPDRAADLDAYLARGGGLVYIHYAVDGGSDAEGFAKRIGLAWRGGRSRFRHGPIDLHFDRGSKHPIARNFHKVHFHDESYWRLTGDVARVNLLATGLEDDEPQPLFWTVEQGKGRVFVSILGHFSWTFDDPLFRTLLLRGIAWTARQPVDRFNVLVTLGARVSDK